MLNYFIDAIKLNDINAEIKISRCTNDIFKHIDINAIFSCDLFPHSFWRNFKEIMAVCRQCVTPVCVENCPVGAAYIDTANGNVRRIDEEKCIGCGLCVSVCHFDALSLVEKMQKNQMEPPADIIDTYMTIAAEKGLI